MENILIVDGMALLFRHYFATAVNRHFMKNSEGIPTNGVQGFIRHTASAILDSRADHVIVAWDMGAVTFRNEISQDYKAHRPAPPEELGPQFEMVQCLSKELRFLNIGVHHYEADDVIGTIAKKLSRVYNVTIISGDRDLLQVLDDNIEVWLIKKGFNIYNRYTRERFKEEYLLEPKQLVDMKALMGDTADGYAGVKGIGEKTAVKLIQQYDSIKGVLEHLEELPKGQQTKIISDQTSLEMSLKLAEIHTDVPLNIEDIEQQMPHTMDIDHMVSICEQHELKVAAAFLKKLEISH